MDAEKAKQEISFFLEIFTTNKQNKKNKHTYKQTRVNNISTNVLGKDSFTEANEFLLGPENNYN